AVVTFEAGSDLCQVLRYLGRLSRPRGSLVTRRLLSVVNQLSADTHASVRKDARIRGRCDFLRIRLCKIVICLCHCPTLASIRPRLPRAALAVAILRFPAAVLSHCSSSVGARCAAKAAADSHLTPTRYFSDGGLCSLQRVSFS